jgi:hypothetical protein
MPKFLRAIVLIALGIAAFIALCSVTVPWQHPAAPPLSTEAPPPPISFGRHNQELADTLPALQSQILAANQVLQRLHRVSGPASLLSATTTAARAKGRLTAAQDKAMLARGTVKDDIDLGAHATSDYFKATALIDEASRQQARIDRALATAAARVARG